MTVTDQLKIIDNKIKANQAQYGLDRLAAKISAFSSGDLRKYEYLTGEDLGYKPSVFEPARFEYSPLGKIFNKGLKEEDKNKGLLKILRNIEGKNEQKLKVSEAQGKKQLDAIKNIKTLKIIKDNQFCYWIKSRGNKIVRWVKKKKKNTIDSENLFVQNLMEQFLTSILLEFASNIYHKGKTSLEEAKKDQYKMLMI